MKKFILPSILLLLLASACRQHEQADLLLYNATVYTMADNFSRVEALAIRDGRIIDTGSSHDIRSRYRAPENINLEGKFVYPGFNDGHTHFYWYAIGLDQLDLTGTGSFAEVLERLQEYAEGRELDFIEGRGWDQNDWGQQEFPNNERLNELFPETPVVLKRVDGHAALVNEAALRYAGLNPDTTIKGGSLLKEEGRFTGILIDNAVDLIEAPLPSEEQGRRALLRAQDSLLKYGITSVTDAGLTTREIDLLKAMYKEGELRVRSNVLVADKPELLDHYLASAPIQGDFLTVRGFKFYLDGALGSRGALMLQPYSDDDKNYGLMLSDAEHFADAARRLKEAGWQMAIHAIGDSANRFALSLYEEVLGDSTDDLRWRVEHAQIVHPKDMFHYGQLSVLPSVQPTHATSDMYWAEKRLGANRIKYAYPYQSLLKQSGRIILGTDFPVEDIDPRKTFVAAVFRQDSAAYPPGGFLPSQALSREECLRGMTHWPAYASFEENYKGRLLPGMAADLVVTDRDLMRTDLKESLQLQVLRSFIAGEQLYQRQAN